MPRSPLVSGIGGGRRTLSSDQITSRYDTALSTNTQEAPTSANTAAPMIGPMTREPFIWAELREMAPARSSRPTRAGKRAL